MFLNKNLLIATSVAVSGITATSLFFAKNEISKIWNGSDNDDSEFLNGEQKYYLVDSSSINRDNFLNQILTQRKNSNNKCLLNSKTVASCRIYDFNEFKKTSSNSFLKDFLVYKSLKIKENKKYILQFATKENIEISNESVISVVSKRDTNQEFFKLNNLEEITLNENKYLKINLFFAKITNSFNFSQNATSRENFTCNWDQVKSPINCEIYNLNHQDINNFQHSLPISSGKIQSVYKPFGARALKENELVILKINNNDIFEDSLNEASITVNSKNSSGQINSSDYLQVKFLKPIVGSLPETKTFVSQTQNTNLSIEQTVINEKKAIIKVKQNEEKEQANKEPE